jgi:hypothetical protein
MQMQFMEGAGLMTDGTLVGADEARATIERAVLTLAGRCDGAQTQDGAGYNKYDSKWGSHAADVISHGGTIDLGQAMRVLTKYRKQLDRAGVTLPSADDVAQVDEQQRAHVEPPRVETQARPSSAPVVGIEIARVESGELHVRFEYDAAKVDSIRGLPTRRWDGALKAWVVPFAGLEALQAIFPDAVLTGTLGEELQAKRDAEAAAERARREQVAADIARYDAILPTLHRKPYEHQDSGIRWLIEQRFAILADDMGLGKTMAALVAARALRHRIFVLCPAGLRENWRREAAAVGARIEIFSWAKVPTAIASEYTLIADEAHYAQNMQAARTKNFLALAKGAKACFCLTGTPIKNGRPANLFPLLVATKHDLGKDRRRYERHFCNAGPTRWTKWDVTGAAHLDELHQCIADRMLRRMKDECLDLPEKVRVLRAAEISAEARGVYDRTLSEMQAEYRRRVAAGEIGEADTLVLMNHLRHAGSLAKVDAAVELAEEVIEQGGQVVLFTAFLDSAGQIAERLDALRITGAEDSMQRQRNIDAFQAGESRAIVCTLGAGNVGITLTAARTVILVDRPWTPGDAIQAEDRAYRIGQTGSVLALWLQAFEFDLVIDELLNEKNERIELVLAGERKSMRGLRTIGDVAAELLGGGV